MPIAKSDTCSISVQVFMFAFNVVMSWVTLFSLICFNRFDPKRFLPSSPEMIWWRASKMLPHRSSRWRRSVLCFCWNGVCIGLASNVCATRLNTCPRVSISSLRLCRTNSTLLASRTNFRALTIATHSWARLAALAVIERGSIRDSNEKRPEETRMRVCCRSMIYAYQERK